ncbi:tyrosine-type recombinase/integrase [Candidatus Woesearchaeota archaeon]|jgi:integrase/recombinase XerD|nr:tyrosine-type recombinase/integrase [Candidatus Woesearchaeota archaeon]MBT4368266.1 tyrosine-type recombinase/integrase [Candidatus Woesearchaeota archaeon]MBT4712755.1 tyrosine-type recombinase/integrase [Candidatus Woesearchaeota archaeon]MBT6639667.1 tyrosine-type recombinase/integrase [Candidatus Woesearchaeota archaeon]MBT7133839.1 tyrosine-type recombinase/integrase [Candidatus Woesearchaeota archaeon]
MDIHGYDKKYEAAINAIKDGDLSASNKELILKFHGDLVLESLSKPRLINYLNKLKLLAKRLNKDFDKVSKDDIKELVSGIQQQTYSGWTKQTYKVMLRRFYVWFERPELVDWINIRISRSEQKLPSEGDLLIEEEVQKLIKLADHPRNKALVSMLWESGARISELGNICIKNVVFDKHGLVLSISGKTGSRKIRLIASTPHLSTWLNVHPAKDDPSAPVWINFGNRRQNQGMVYPAMCKMLRDLFKKAGMKKRSNPHLFRHSRATFMANHLTEFQMNQYFGWIQGSKMPSTYVHMSGKAVDSAILKMNGIEVESDKELVQERPRVCPRCDTINSYDSKHCNKCGGILDLKYAMEMDTERKHADDMMAKMLEDPKIKELFFERLKELKGVF